MRRDLPLTPEDVAAWARVPSGAVSIYMETDCRDYWIMSTAARCPRLAEILISQRLVIVDVGPIRVRA